MAKAQHNSEHNEILLQTAALLFNGKEITSEFLRTRFGCSKATAKRYLIIFECNLPVKVNVLAHNKKVLSLMQ